MNIEQKRVYRKVLEEATSELENQEHVTANNVVSQMMRLHQVVCGHVKNEEGKIEDLGNNRTNALIDILDEHGGKAIIWVYYDYEIRRLVEQLKKEYGEDAVAAFWGGNLKSRSKEEIRFLSDEECRFMVATPASGGYGNTWNVANLTVYMANSYDLEHRFQSEDRNHRYGQKDKVTYIDIMTPDTVEERIITSLRKKINLNSIITGENYREWLI
jgi:SNF2 family DNA or RNA helicase